MNIDLETAVNSEGAFRSELIRRALRYYIRDNPDRISVFREGSPATHSKETQLTADRTSSEANNVYNPLEDL